MELAGRRIIYAAETYAGAMLEALIHANIGRLPKTQSWIEILIPKGIRIEEARAADLPGWDAADQRASRRYGDRWYDERRTAILLVPSIVARPERNIAINQEHPDFRRIRATAPRPVIWDQGLFRPERKLPWNLLETSLLLETTPQDIQRRLAAGEKLLLIDVREPAEFQVASIPNAELIPMRTVPAQLQRLEAASDEATLIVYCHHGFRSLNVVNWLREQGLGRCQSMAGGIDRWSLQIDASVPRYS
jgi:rhodanese-related sulfurtransferase/RES domain-containing protein